MSVGAMTGRRPRGSYRLSFGVRKIETRPGGVILLNGKRLNLLYGTQVSSRPPRFRLFVNDRSLVTRDYGYWVENELRRRFRLEGVPVSIDFVTSE